MSSVESTEYHHSLPAPPPSQSVAERRASRLKRASRLNRERRMMQSQSLKSTKTTPAAAAVSPKDKKSPADDTDSSDDVTSTSSSASSRGERDASAKKADAWTQLTKMSVIETDDDVSQLLDLLRKFSGLDDQ